MSEVKHIQIGSTSYDVTDAAAQNGLISSAAFADDSTNNSSSPVKMTLTKVGGGTVVQSIPVVSTSSAGVVPKGATVSSQSQSTKFLREDGSWAAPSYTSNTNTTYKLNINGTNNGGGSTSLGTVYAPTSAGTQGQLLIANASGVPAWGSKPSYNYGEIGYSVGTATGSSSSLTIANPSPITIVTVSANISSVQLSTTGTFQLGHSYHVVFMTGSADTNEYTIQMSTATASSIDYVCPDSDGIELTVPKQAGGYAEVDFLCIAVPVSGSGNYKFLVRGV